MVSIADLPQELVDQIVSELEDDPTSLRTCALVAPAFLPSSRERLFTTVRVTASNLFAFGKLIESSPAVAAYIRRLDVPTTDRPAVLSVALIALLPNLTHLSSHCDPFDFRHLSHSEARVLEGASARLTSVTVLINRLWPLPAWAAFLNACPALTTLSVHADANGWGTWTAQGVAELPMPVPPAGSRALRLHTLAVSGDCKILVPLGAWLLPQRALANLHTLVLSVEYVLDDYTAPDARVPLVRAAAASLRELTLTLDPPMLLTSTPHPLCVPSSFPHLHTLRLTDGPDAEIGASLAWLGAFLDPGLAHNRGDRGPADSALERITLDHSMVRRDLLAVPAETWRALEEALLGGADAYPTHRQPHRGTDVDELARSFAALSAPSSASSSTYIAPTAYSALRSLTFTGYQKFSIGGGAPDAFEHFSKTVRERLPRLVGRGVVVVRR
ncbi:hypothetical protein C8R46DRAFT_1184346 [Mycena filopes]|nr:hypothetical protein C8R46DRAFT_1184346 [Mycena filopes]